jgi:hypothetical protein
MDHMEIAKHHLAVIEVQAAEEVEASSDNEMDLPTRIVISAIHSTLASVEATHAIAEQLAAIDGTLDKIWGSLPNG